MYNKNDSRIGVALVNEACPLCGKLQDGPIIINTRSSHRDAKNVEELNGKTIGFSKEPCAECKEMMSKGFLLIGVVESKCTGSALKDIYRSGNTWVITHKSAKRLFPSLDLSKGAAFFPVEIAHDLGFPDCKLDA